MKINNKGLTLVELIVAFVILVMFLFGMLGIVLAVKNKAANEFFDREMMTYRQTLLKTVQDDFIKRKLEDAECTSNTCTFTFEGNIERTFSLNTTTKIIEYNGTKYDIPNGDRIYFGTVRMAVDNPGASKPLMLVIDIPYYEVDTVTPNLGIKIVYPLPNE